VACFDAMDNLIKDILTMNMKTRPPNSNARAAHLFLPAQMLGPESFFDFKLIDSFGYLATSCRVLGVDYELERRVISALKCLLNLGRRRQPYTRVMQVIKSSHLVEYILLVPRVVDDTTNERWWKTRLSIGYHECGTIGDSRGKAQSHVRTP
jgi:hypothetical protein